MEQSNDIMISITYIRRPIICDVYSRWQIFWKLQLVGSEKHVEGALPTGAHLLCHRRHCYTSHGYTRTLMSIQNYALSHVPERAITGAEAVQLVVFAGVDDSKLACDRQATGARQMRLQTAPSMRRFINAAAKFHPALRKISVFSEISRFHCSTLNFN